MRGTGQQEKKWNFAARYVPGIPVDRAKLRFTTTYAIAPGAFIGVEYNPLEDDVGLLANWRIVDETKTRPMVMLGTSSDRIGTPSGRAYFATVSKAFSLTADIAISPYIGTSFGEFDDEFVELGGIGIRWTEDLRSTHSWDGHNLHHFLDYTLGDGYRAGFVLAEQGDHHYGGLSLGLSL